MIVNTTTPPLVGCLWEEYGRLQVAVFAGGERKYGSLHGRCNATHADKTENAIVLWRVSSWLYPLRSKTSDQQELFIVLVGG